MDIKILINTLFSKDFRETISELLKSITKKPEWKEKIKKYKEKITYRKREMLLDIISAVKRNLLDYNYSESRVEDIRVVITELTNNAFEHGCNSNENSSITIEVNVSPEWVKISVKDSGAGFDVNLKLDEMKELLSKDPLRSRGRGLLHISSIADDLCNIKSNEICALVLKNERRIFLSKNVMDRLNCNIFKIEGEMDSYTCSVIRKRFSEVLSTFTIRDRIFILDINDVCYIDSTGLGVIIYMIKRLRGFFRGNYVLKNLHYLSEVYVNELVFEQMFSIFPILPIFLNFLLKFDSIPMIIMICDNPQIIKIFRITGLIKLIDLYKNIEEAKKQIAKKYLKM